ncbi:YaaL family protein [Paenibacillus rhizovicinus]|uniref:YaaL family protein n=1 Tax=Paenibacillus rhizovicinus TaxID=2704463 RepID=A0A6C0P5T6_9BACL|nr:YaaL family protein [Paenibacillus rhizovicinus]QHW31972.1 YaaL family protein [Paenibacillus rhizovicinus]
MWNWLKRKKRTANLMRKNEQQEQLELIEEINTAKREWENARRFFEYAVDSDQIDYAVFAISSAEKRYEMLIRKAKRMPVQWTLPKGGVMQ